MFLTLPDVLLGLQLQDLLFLWLDFSFHVAFVLFYLDFVGIFEILVTLEKCDESPVEEFIDYVLNCKGRRVFFYRMVRIEMLLRLTDDRDGSLETIILHQDLLNCLGKLSWQLDHHQQEVIALLE